LESTVERRWNESTHQRGKSLFALLQQTFLLFVKLYNQYGAPRRTFRHRVVAALQSPPNAACCFELTDLAVQPLALEHDYIQVDLALQHLE
jgi:hypothetical protein